MEFFKDFYSSIYDNQNLIEQNEIQAFTSNPIEIYFRSVQKNFLLDSNFDNNMFYDERQMADWFKIDTNSQYHEQKQYEALNQGAQPDENIEVVVGDIFYLWRQIANTKNIFKGYSEILEQKIVGVIFNIECQTYYQLNVANSYIEQYNAQEFFNTEVYQIGYKYVQSQYSIFEFNEQYNEKLSIYSIQKYFKGSLEDLILARKKMKMPFSNNELEDIFQRLLLIGSSLQCLFFYHQNLKPSKILLNFNRKTFQFDKQSLTLSSLQEIYKFNSNDEFFDNMNYDLEQFNFNGYVSPEIADFQPQIMIFKQNSFSIGLFMLNLLLLDIFSTSRFIDGYQKGIYLLQNENISASVRKGVNLLLQQDQQQRKTCKEVLKEIYNQDFNLHNNLYQFKQQASEQEQLECSLINNKNQDKFYQENNQIRKQQQDDNQLDCDIINSQDDTLINLNDINVVMGKITETQENCALSCQTIDENLILNINPKLHS
ncbi:hypothetical protein ABPG74_009664 [Tetrahymena malaccensis]